MSGFLARLFRRAPRDLAGVGLYLHAKRGVAVPAWASRMYVTDFGLGAETFEIDEDAVGQAVLNALSRSTFGRPPKSLFTSASYTAYPHKLREGLGLTPKTTLWSAIDRFDIRREGGRITLIPNRNEGRGGFTMNRAETVVVDAAIPALDLGRTLFEMRARGACG